MGAAFFEAGFSDAGFFDATAGTAKGAGAGPAATAGMDGLFADFLVTFVTTTGLPAAAFLTDAFLAVVRVAGIDDALGAGSFFTAFLLAAFLATTFFAVLRAACFATFLPATAFFTAFLRGAAVFLTTVFLLVLAPLDALRAADFFAADLRVVAMRAYSSGDQ